MADLAYREVYRMLGYRGGDTIAYMPPIVLADVSVAVYSVADILLSFDKDYGRHLLTQYGCSAKSDRAVDRTRLSTICLRGGSRP